jgi:hypothetical protein
MAKISMIVPDEELALIDEFASPNRTAFMLRAVREAIAGLQRARTDAEIERCLAETAEDDVALSREFAGVSADGL